MKPIQAWLVGGSVLLGACSTPVVRPQSPDDIENLGAKVQVVGDLAIADGFNPIKVEAVGLVTGLDGTGSDPDPSPQREALRAEMQTRGVEDPDLVLASPNTSLVHVLGYLRPGIQQGERFDIEVRVPAQSQTTSLRSGWLMETRLAELAVLDRIRTGELWGLAEGAVLIDPAADEQQNQIALLRGRVLGGAVATRSRTMGLVLKPEHQSVAASQQIGDALNRRFHVFKNTIKAGVAVPRTHQFIELAVHPRYKDNIDRYMQVVRSVAVRESPTERSARLELLERQMLEPVTASNAALRLEAIGADAVAVLKKGLPAGDPEVRFYAAEALAYLDDSSAAQALAEAAKNEPAFRAYALTALSAMDDFAAEEALRSLLDVPSAETRYGAFRALWAMNPHNDLIRGEELGGQFSYHVLRSHGPPMIHVTRNRRPEIVMFGPDQHFQPPMVVDAGKQIMVDARDGSEITVSKFTVNEPDQKRVVSTRVDDVIRAIVELGGTYPDVVQALQQAKQSQALVSRFEVDALPTGGREYVRGSAPPDGEQEKASGSQIVVDNPVPELFAGRDEKPERPKKAKSAAASTQEPERLPLRKAIFAKIRGERD